VSKHARATAACARSRPTSGVESSDIDPVVRFIGHQQFERAEAHSAETAP
jgi:hypothetical protein